MLTLSGLTTIRRQSVPPKLTDSQRRAKLILIITDEKGQTTEYCVTPVRDSLSGWAVAFRLRKRSDGTTYQVSHNGRCNCPCGVYRGKAMQCRHVSALRSLGLLPEDN